jgi:hypothetical protein
MATTLSAAAVAKFDAPSAVKFANSDDDEGDVSTVDLYSRQASTESEASSELTVSDTRGGDKVIEECELDSQTKRVRPALEDVLMSLPHFREARSDAEEDSSEDEDAVLRIGQLARRFALGR